MRMFSLLALVFAACVSAQSRPIETPAEGGAAKTEVRERTRSRDAKAPKAEEAPKVVERRVIEVSPKPGAAILEVEGIPLPRPTGRQPGQDPAPKPSTDRSDMERRLQELTGRLDRLQRILETRLQDGQPQQDGARRSIVQRVEPPAAQGPREQRNPPPGDRPQPQRDEQGQRRTVEIGRAHV